MSVRHTLARPMSTEERLKAGAKRARRRFVFVLALCWAVGATLFLHGLAGSALAATHGRVVYIQAGDTLWNLAEKYSPDTDPRTAVEQILVWNHLMSGTTLYPGEKLLIPG